MLPLKSAWFRETIYADRSGQGTSYRAREWAADPDMAPPRPAGSCRIFRDDLGWVHVYETGHPPVMVPPQLVRNVVPFEAAIAVDDFVEPHYVTDLRKTGWAPAKDVGSSSSDTPSAPATLPTDPALSTAGKDAGAVPVSRVPPSERSSNAEPAPAPATPALSTAPFRAEMPTEPDVGKRGGRRGGKR